MRPTLKIVLGSLMIIAGIYWYSMDAAMGTGTSNLDALFILLKGSVGLFVLLLGVFVVWIESDEMRIQRELEQQDFQPEEYPDQEEAGAAEAEVSSSEVEIATPDYEEIVSGTIDEVKDAVAEQDLDLEELLRVEQQNKDRKTLKSWLESRMDS